MDQAMLAYLQDLTANNPEAVAIMPFVDIHGYQPEPLLPYGMPFLIYDMFSNANPQLIHPYYSLAVVNGLGISGDKLADVTHIKTVAEKLGARYVVYGSVQRSTPSEVRVIIGVYNAKTAATISPAVQYATEFNDALFGLTRSNLQEAFKRARASLHSADYRDPSMQAFRFYLRGLQLSEHYNQTNLEMAALWFEKALKEDYHKFDDAALGMARSFFMSALAQKLNKVDHTQNMLKARKTLEYIRNKRDTRKYDFVYRFVHGHTAFVNALTASKNGNANLAAVEAIDALTLVPEDGMAEEIYWTSDPNAQLKPKITRRRPVCLH